eukprot:2020444-Pyramimonas_sp.AAC.1
MSVPASARAHASSTCIALSARITLFPASIRASPARRTPAILSSMRRRVAHAQSKPAAEVSNRRLRLRLSD